MSKCPFCTILSRENPASIIYEDEGCTVFLDIHPVNPGHILVVPNQHAASLAELDADTGPHLFRVAHRLVNVLRSSDIRCEGVNIFLADGEAAGQDVSHVHIHVIPRYEDDGFGLRFALNYPTNPSREELDTAAEQIRREVRH